jgi:hypothetical protein
MTAVLRAWKDVPWINFLCITLIVLQTFFSVFPFIPLQLFNHSFHTVVGADNYVITFTDEGLSD